MSDWSAEESQAFGDKIRKALAGDDIPSRARAYDPLAVLAEAVLSLGEAVSALQRDVHALQREARIPKFDGRYR